MTDEEKDGIRGDDLAEGVGGGAAGTGEADGGGVRGGEGLAQDAGGGTPPHGDQLAEGSPRGDGLADDAA
jgi:hypothetical protein